MNISKELTLKLLEESPSFRDWAVNILLSHDSDIRSSVISYLVTNRNKKIECIKWIRTNFSVGDLSKAFPEFRKMEGFVTDNPGLKDAKEFVEFYFEKVS